MSEILRIFRFSFRELRQSFRHFRILFLCLVLGVCSIATVQSLSKGLMEALRYDGRYILGGDIAVRTIGAPMAEAMKNQLRDEVGTLSVNMETRVMVRSDDEAQSMMIELKGFDDLYPLYGAVKFTDDAGTAIEKTPQEVTVKNDDIWGAAVEKAVLEQFNMQLGDVLRIGDQRLQIRAIVAHEPDRLGSSRFSISPRIMVDYRAIENETFLKTGIQIFYYHRFLTPQYNTITELEAAKDVLLTKAPSTELWRGQIFLDAAPGIRRAVERLDIFLTLMSLTALLIGGIGIGNAVTAYLQKKYSVIATLKCIGAKQKTIFWIYFVQMILISIPGIFCGVILGAVIPQFISPLLTSRLALSNQIGFYPDILLAAAAFGFLIVAMFVIWPVAKACRVSASDLFRSRISAVMGRPSWPYLAATFLTTLALAVLVFVNIDHPRMSQYFVTFSLVSLVAFLMLSYGVQVVAKKIRVRRYPSLRMAISYLYRPGNTTTSVLMSMGFGMAMMVMIAMVEANFSMLLKDDAVDNAPSFFFLDIQQRQKDDFVRVVENAQTARNLQVTPILRGRITQAKGMTAEKAFVDERHGWVMRGDRRFTYMAEQPDDGLITEGEWWPENYDGDPLISISRDVAEAFAMAVGDALTVTILGRDVTATVANIRDINWTNFTMNFAVTFSPNVLERFPASYIGTVMVDDDYEMALQNALAKELPNVTSVRVGEVMNVAQTLIGFVGQAVRLGSIVTIFIGLLVLQGSVLSGQQQRLYDSVVLKILGITRKRLGHVFLMEYGVLSFIVMLVAGVLGCILSFGIFEIIMDMTWKFSWSALWEISVICVGLTLLIGYLNIRRVLAHKPAAFLRQNE